jgi:predicted nucleic acid-binding protein
LRLLIDTNVILDAALKREGFAYCDQVLEACKTQLHDGFMTWHTVSTIYYILVERNSVSLDGFKLILGELTSYLTVGQSSNSLLDRAMRIQMDDFEDAMQAVVAMDNGCDWIITNNIKDFKSSPVKGISATEFLEVE